MICPVPPKSPDIAAARRAGQVQSNAGKRCSHNRRSAGRDSAPETPPFQKQIWLLDYGKILLLEDVTEIYRRRPARRCGWQAVHSYATAQCTDDMAIIETRWLLAMRGEIRHHVEIQRRAGARVREARPEHDAVLEGVSPRCIAGKDL